MKHLVFLSLLSSSLLAACGDDGSDPGEPANTARFADATAEQLGRAMAAAVGGDAMIAQFIAGGYAAFPIDGSGPSCPSIARDGATTIVTGGCDLDDGGRVEGVLRFENVPPIFGEGEYDPLAVTRIVFEDYRAIEADGSEWYFDGEILDAPSGRLSIDLTADIGTGRAHLDLELYCDDEPSCAAIEDSRIEVDGLGSASVGGTWSLAEPPSGQVMLIGADELILDFDAATAECVPYTIDGEDAGELCDLE